MNVSAIKGIGSAYAKKLKKAQITKIGDLREMNVNEISKKSGIGILHLTKWKKEASRIYILKDIKGIGQLYQKKLEKIGIMNIESLSSADAQIIAKKTGVSLGRIESWIAAAMDMTQKKRGKKAVIAEKIGPENAHIHVKKRIATVRIKEKLHRGVEIFDNGEENKAQNESIAVIAERQDEAKLWFKGKWYENVPITIEKTGLIDKIKKIFWGNT